MWDLPGAGIEPVSPAMAGGLLTTAPPGKSHVWRSTEVVEEGSIKRFSHFSHWLLGQGNIFRAIVGGKAFLSPAGIDLTNCRTDIPQRQEVLSERNSKQGYNSTGHS